MPINIIKKFIHLESAGGIILFATALLAILIDNSPLSIYYEHLLELPLSIGFGDFILSKHLLHWINDGLMVIFFLLVGLEIKRELVDGELNTPPKVILPGLAALGGMIAPALIFTLINYHNTFAMRGWAIPTATDIAFSLGILSLLGKRVPVSLKIFLMALAIFDDLGAILVIALFYNSKISFVYLSFAFIIGAFLIILNRFNVKSIPLYLAIGFLLWLVLLHSGIHPTLSGVILALAIPLSKAKTLAKKIHPYVAFIILPIFAFANAGVSFDDVPSGLNNIFSPVMLGIFLGLLLGKMMGVFSITYIAIKMGLTKMPNQASWPQILGISLVCGVGFTMSFFVGALAYPAETSLGPYQAWVRLGVLSGSLLSGLLGYVVLRLTTKP